VIPQLPSAQKTANNFKREDGWCLVIYGGGGGGGPSGDGGGGGGAGGCGGDVDDWVYTKGKCNWLEIFDNIEKKCSTRIFCMEALIRHSQEPLLALLELD
jgi:hypothetical protein